MKALETLILFPSLFVYGMNVSTDNKSNLIYNSEEVNDMKVAETVCEMGGSTLTNYMKYSYKYDNQNRMTESEAMKWNAVRDTWTNDMYIHYVYQGRSVTTTYYKWNNKKGTYVLIPEATITVNNLNM